MNTFFDGAAISLVTVARPATLFGKLKVLWDRSTRLFCIVASTSSQLAVGDTTFVHTEAYEVFLDGFSNRRMLAILEGLVSSKLLEGFDVFLAIAFTRLAALARCTQYDILINRRIGIIRTIRDSF
jgi:hypothetical protein